MENRKTTKTICLLCGLILIILSLFDFNDWGAVGIYTNCNLIGRFSYHFFHVNLLHSMINVWCLLSIVFIYDIVIKHISLAYIIASTIPINLIGSAIPTLNTPTIGLSAIIFVLYGLLSFSVVKKLMYQGYMLFFLAVGFFVPNVSAVIHLYCYLVGCLLSLFNHLIKSYRYGKR